MITAATLELMLAAGMTAAQIVEVVKVEIAAFEAAELSKLEAEEAAAVRRREVDRERQRRHRASRTVTRDQRDVTLQTVTQQEHIETTEERARPRTSADNMVSIGKKEESKKERKTDSRRVQIPRDWQVSEEGRTHAFSQGWDESRLCSEVLRFVDHARSHARRSADWNAAWRSWVTSPYQNGTGNGRYGAPRPGSKEDTREETVLALRELSAHVRGRCQAADRFVDDGLPGFELVKPEGVPDPTLRTAHGLSVVGGVGRDPRRDGS